MEALIKDIFTFLLQYYALYLVIVMSIITTLIMMILKFAKIPFKKLTLKISNEKARKILNRIFIFFLSFALSFIIWYLLGVVLPQYFTIDYKEVFINGAMPIVVYAFAEGWVSTDKAKQVVESIVDKVVDGKLTKEEVKETVKELNTSLDAEQELQKLLKK